MVLYLAGPGGRQVFAETISFLVLSLSQSKFFGLEMLLASGHSNVGLLPGILAPGGILLVLGQELLLRFAEPLAQIDALGQSDQGGFIHLAANLGGGSSEVFVGLVANSGYMSGLVMIIRFFCGIRKFWRQGDGCERYEYRGEQHGGEETKGTKSPTLAKHLLLLQVKTPYKK